MSGPHAKKVVKRTRVRRGNVEDREALKRALIDAAMTLFLAGGIEAVTMRAVAQRVGVSPMAAYRYFTDKADLLSGLWKFILQGLYADMAAAIKPLKSARAQQFAMNDANLSYWENHPGQHRLLYMTEGALRPADQSTLLTQHAVYSDLLQLVQQVTSAFAAEIGGDQRRVKLANDMRLAMLQGYLHAKLINQRYPWGDLAVLRKLYIEQVVAATERCLLGDAKPRKAAPRRMA